MYNSWELLHKRLLQLATRHGFQAELARKMGVSSTVIQYYIAGERKPGIDQLDKFAEALGVQPWELIKPDAAVPTPEPKVMILTNLTEDQLIAAHAAISGAVSGDLPKLDK